jgi:hypothetical protein
MRSKLTFWTKEMCIKSAVKYETISEWDEKEPNAKAAAVRNGWKDECTRHMRSRVITIEDCMETAKKYSSLTDWRLEHSPHYTKAHRSGWLSKCTKHMIPNRVSWTKKKILDIAKKYKTPREWEINCKKSYSAATKYGLLEEAQKHMKVRTLYYSYEDCIKDAKKHQTISDWRNNGKCFMSAYNKGKQFYRRCIKHMKPKERYKTIIKNLDTNEIFLGFRKAQEKYRGCSKIGAVVTGQRRTAGGYRWAYCDKKGNILK